MNAHPDQRGEKEELLLEIEITKLNLKKMILEFILQNPNISGLVEERFIDNLTLLSRRGFLEFIHYKRLMHIFTITEWYNFDNDSIQSYLFELKELILKVTINLDDSDT